MFQELTEHNTNNSACLKVFKIYNIKTKFSANFVIN